MATTPSISAPGYTPYTPPAMTARGGSPSVGPVPGYQPAYGGAGRNGALGYADNMVSIGGLRSPVRIQGPRFDPSMKPEDYNKVMSAWTGALSGRPADLTQALDVVKANPNLPGMLDLLTQLDSHPDVASTLGALFRDGKFEGRNANLAMMHLLGKARDDREGSRILTSDPGQRIFRAAREGAGNGDADSLSTLAFLATSRGVDPSLRRSLRSDVMAGVAKNPQMGERMQSWLQSQGFSHDARLPESELAVVRDRNLLRAGVTSQFGKAEDWKRYRENLTTSLEGEHVYDGQARPSQNPAQDETRRLERAEFLRAGSEQLAKDPRDPRRGELVRMGSDILGRSDLTANTADVVAAFERMKPLSEQEQTIQNMAKQRLDMGQAAQNPASLDTPEKRQAMFDMAGRYLRSGEWNQKEAAAVLGALNRAGHLTPEHIRQLGGGAKSREGREFLSDIVRNHQDPAMKTAASEVMAGNLRDAGNVPTGRQEAVRILGDNGSPEARARAAEQTPSQGLNDESLRKFQGAYSQKVDAFIKDAMAGKMGGSMKSEVTSWLKGMRAQHLAETKFAGNPRVDAQAIQNRIRATGGGQLIGQHLAKLQHDTIMENPQLKQQLDYLKGPDFQARLKLLTPEQKQQEVKTQLEALNKMSPSDAAAVFQQLSEKEIDNKLPEVLSQMRPEQLEKLLKAGAHHHGIEAIDKGLAGAEAAHAIHEGIEHFQKMGKKPTGEELAKHLADHGHGNLARAISAAPPLLAAANLFDNAAHGFEGKHAGLEAGRDTLLLLEGAANLKSLHTALQGYKALGKGMNFVGKVAGPAAAALSAKLEFDHAAEAVLRGDDVRAGGYFTAGTGCTLMAAGGTLTATGVGAPVGAALLIAGGVLAIGGTVATFFGDDDETEFMKTNGFWKR